MSRIHHIGLIFISVGFLLCCTKRLTRHCETWQLRDECIPKTISAMCLGNYSVRQSLLCNDDLDGIYEGKVDTLSEDENYIYTRIFIKKVR